MGGVAHDIVPPRYTIDTVALFRRFKFEFDRFHDTLLCEMVPDEFRRRMERFADAGPNGSGLAAEEWMNLINRFLFAYRFETAFQADDVVDALFPFFLGRLWTIARATEVVRERLSEGNHIDAKRVAAITRRETEDMIERQVDCFEGGRSAFRSEWRERRSAARPYLPKIGAWEFVPRVGVVVPQELEKPGGGHVWASDVYQSLLDRYRNEFMRFLCDHLDLIGVADSGTILTRVHDFMVRVDRALEESVFTDDLSTFVGTEALARHVVQNFAQSPSFQLTP